MTKKKLSYAKSSWRFTSTVTLPFLHKDTKKTGQSCACARSPGATRGLAMVQQQDHELILVGLLFISKSKDMYNITNDVQNWSAVRLCICSSQQFNPFALQAWCLCSSVSPETPKAKATHSVACWKTGLWGLVNQLAPPNRPSDASSSHQNHPVDCIWWLDLKSKVQKVQNTNAVAQFPSFSRSLASFAPGGFRVRRPRAHTKCKWLRHKIAHSNS